MATTRYTDKCNFTGKSTVYFVHAKFHLRRHHRRVLACPVMDIVVHTLDDSTLDDRRLSDQCRVWNLETKFYEFREYITSQGRVPPFPFAIMTKFLWVTDFTLLSSFSKFGWIRLSDAEVMGSGRFSPKIFGGFYGETVDLDPWL